MKLLDRGKGDMLSLHELGKFLGCRRRAIICSDEAGWSTLDDEFL